MTSSRALVAKSPVAKADPTSLSNIKPATTRSETPASSSSSPSYSFGDIPLYDSDGNRWQEPRAFKLPWPVQAKLEVGNPDDPLEDEADKVADPSCVCRTA